MAISTFSLKHFILKLISASIAAWGLYGLYRQTLLLNSFLTIFNKGTINHTQDTYQYLLFFIFITASINFILTSYGFALIIRPSNLVKVGHIIVGILLIILSLTINKQLGLNQKINLIIKTPQFNQSHNYEHQFSA